MAIFDVIPRPVPVELGEETYLASEYRLGDLSDLEAYVRAHRPSPFDVAELALSRLTPHSIPYRTLLGDTMEAQDNYPYGLTSDEANEVLGNTGGIVFMAWLSLRREQPGLTVEDVATILTKTTRIQFSRLRRVYWASDPMDKMLSIILGDNDQVGEERDWGAAWYHYTTKCKNGPPFDQLTLTQLSLFMNEGEKPDSGIFSGPLETFDFGRRRKIDKYINVEEE